MFELFSQIGTVTTVRVCRDAVTRRSLGYAYVNYQNHEDGERALEQLNYIPLKGRPMRIMWSQRDPTLRRAGTGNIFIKNLDPSIDNKALHDTFSAFGTILSCKVAGDENGPKGYGFVHFVEQESAEAAIEAVNGMLLNDRKVYVGMHVSKKERQSKLDETRSQFTNVYVKNLDESVTDDDFKEMFIQFGAITSAAVTRDDEGKSKGFGFVNFENHEEAKKAVDEMNDKEINGKTLVVCRAQKKSEREEELRKQFEKVREEKMNKYQGVNLYVKNLDESIDDETLRQEFSAFGTITSSKIMRDDKTGVSKGFGFVCFSSPEEATKAVTEMNGRMVNGKPIYVALAQRKDIRRQILATQMMQRSQIRMQQPMPGVPGYPGAPMFYPGPVPQAGRGGMFFQQPMVRPGFPGRGQMPAGAYPPQPNMPQQFGAVPVAGAPQGARPPRPQRQAGRGGPGPNAQGGQMMGGPGPMPQAGRGRGQFKYTPNARNAPNGAGAPTAAAVVAGTAAPSAGNKDQFNPANFASLSETQQKRALGEALYPLIRQYNGSLAGKVTGMLLEMDNGELLHLLESPDALKSKVDEAIEALEEYQRQKEEATN